MGAFRFCQGDILPVMEINRQYASKNFWRGNDPRSIMLHTTGGGSLIGAIETLKARGLSYNYIFCEGKVYELVHYKNSAWHAGVVKGMNMRSQIFYKTGKGEDNPNRHSIGFSFVYPKPDYKVLNDVDVDNAVLLMKQIGKETNQRFNADNIFYHREVTNDKPIIVQGYRNQILEALIGDKDDKDVVDEKYLKLMIQFLQLRIQLLLLQLKQ